MAGKVLIPSAERWARVCGQERRDCLQPLAVLGSSGPAGWPCSDMFILQAQAGPRCWQGWRRVLGDGDRLAAGGLFVSMLACSLPPSCFHIHRGKVWSRGQEAHRPSEALVPTPPPPSHTYNPSVAPSARRPSAGQGSRLPLETSSEPSSLLCGTLGAPSVCLLASVTSHSADSCRAPSIR